jgi:hypothetical protein
MTGPSPEKPAPAGYAQQAALFSIMTGGLLAQACYAVAKLGVPDLLADGPRDVDGLAAASGSDPRALRRILRVLSAAGLFQETAPGSFALTATGALLCSNARGSSRPVAVMLGEEVHRASGEIVHTLRSGQPAFEQIHGTSFYDYLGEHPEADTTFSAAMAVAAVPPALVRCDLAGLGTLVDVGGGDGGLLAHVLARQRAARGVLVDLPGSVEKARARLAGAGLEERARFVAGSFFDAGTVPAGGDVYTLSRVLHNWDDADALTILRRVREAIPPHGRLFVFEYLEDAAPAAAPDAGASPAAAQARMIDLLMLVMLDGHDRTEAEYRDLLAAAGFRVRSVRPAPFQAARGESVIEATAV